MVEVALARKVRPGGTEHPFGEPHHEPVERQRLGRINKRAIDRVNQRRVIGDLRRNERQRCGSAGQCDQRIGNLRRLDVDQVVAEAALVAGPTVVYFVGVEHHDLTGQTPLDGASIVKGLDAKVGHPDGVAVVAMRFIAAAAELRAQELDTVDGGAMLQPITRRARSFKTVGPGDCHAGSLRVTFEQTISFAVFSVVAAGTPGPSNTLLTATGAQVGVWRGLPALFGVAVGMGVMMFVVGFGLGTVVLSNPMVLTVLKWCGAVVLLWLAWKIATAGVHSDGSSGQKPVGFVGAAGFQWVNPKAWLASASAAAAFLSGGESALVQALAFGAIFFALSIPSCFPWLAFGAVMQRFLRSERTTRVFNGLMGVLLACSVVLMLR